MGTVLAIKKPYDVSPFFFLPLLLPFVFRRLCGGMTVALSPLRTMFRASFSAKGASLNIVPLQHNISSG